MKQQNVTLKIVYDDTIKHTPADYLQWSCNRYKIRNLFGAVRVEVVESNAPKPLALEPPADEHAIHARIITELNLSVRGRKCTTKLGIVTIGELVRLTAEDLLECKNFGVSSLNEVREKLAERGLKLRGD